MWVSFLRCRVFANVEVPLGGGGYVTEKEQSANADRLWFAIFQWNDVVSIGYIWESIVCALGLICLFVCYSYSVFL